ncbi:MAG: preprotein translocase subunit YajC [Bacteroidia bacterium]|jgi:preprotein translocase subunit YajC
MDLIILQVAPAPAGGGGYSMIIMLGAMFVVMYFFMIRPQMKKNKAQIAFKEGIKKGEKIVTTGGIHGKIAEIRDTTFIIDTEAGGKLKIEKSSVSMDSTNILNGQPATKK